MKLPDIQYRAVESVGRHDLGALDVMAGAVGRQGQMFQQAATELAGVTGEYIERKQNAEFDEQIASYQIDFDAWDSEVGARDFWTAEEVMALGLPSHLIETTETTTDVAGKTVTSERQNIPAYEVYPHLLKAKLAGMTAEKAEKISNPHLRQEFMRKAAINEANLNMQAAFNAENAQEKYVLETGILNYQNAGDRGDVDAGQFYIDQLVTDDLHKSQLTEDLHYRVEFFEVTASIRSNEPETVALTLSRLTDPQYEGWLSEGERQAAVTSLDNKLKILGADAKAEVDRLEGIDFVNFIERVKTGESSPEEIKQRFDNWVDDPNAKDILTDTQYARAMDIQRSYDNAVVTEARRVAAAEKVAEKERIAAIKAEKVLFDAAWKEANAVFYSQVGKDIDDNAVHLPDVERSYQTHLDALIKGETPPPNSLDYKQRTSMRHHIMERDKKAIAATESFDRGKGMVEYGDTASRENQQHQDDVDEYVKQTQENIGRPMTVQELVTISQDTNIMPQILEDSIVHSALNLKEDAAIPGLAAYGAILDNQKQGLLDLGGSTRDLMNSAWYYHQTGMSAVESLEKANELSQMQPHIREEHKKKYARLDAYDDNADILASKMADDEARLYPFDPGIMTGALGPNSQMEGDYQMIVAREYERTGDIAMSRETAWNVLSETWSPSGVGVRRKGDDRTSHHTRADRYGVERSLGINTEVANNRLAAFANANGLDVGSVVVFGDAYSARKNPTWDIMVVDPQTGEYDRVYDLETGQSLRWNPNHWVEEGKVYGRQQKVNAAKGRKESGKVLSDMGAEGL